MKTENRLNYFKVQLFFINLYNVRVDTYYYYYYNNNNNNNNNN